MTAGTGLDSIRVILKSQPAPVTHGKEGRLNHPFLKQTLKLGELQLDLKHEAYIYRAQSKSYIIIHPGLVLEPYKRR